MNEAEITAANRELIPDVMVQATVMRMPNGMILTGGPRSTEMIQQSARGMAMQKTDWMYSIMASITLPFAPWSSDTHRQRRTKCDVTNLSIEAEKKRHAAGNDCIVTLGFEQIRYS